MGDGKVLVLGAGRGQIPIMDLCHGYGRKVVAVSPRGDYPGLKVADEVVFENVKDVEAVVRAARSAGVSAVVTDQLDAGVYTGACVAEELDIPGIGREVARLFTDKQSMREAAASAGVAVPPSKRAGSADDAAAAAEAIGYPVMIKPVDSAASKGVFKVADERELLERYPVSRSFSSCGELIVEGYVNGGEYVVESFTCGGVTRPLVVGHREYFDIEGAFIPSATVFRDAGSADSHVERKVLEAALKIPASFGLPFGITHGEFIYDAERDEAVLVEIAARGGGVFISSHLIPYACGVSAGDLAVRAALDMPVDMGFELTRGASAYFCYLVPEGTVDGVGGIERVGRIPGVEKAFFDNIAPGMKTAGITNKTSRKGPILVKAPTKEGCLEVREEIKRALDVRVLTPAGVRRAIW